MSGHIMSQLFFVNPANSDNSHVFSLSEVIVLSVRKHLYTLVVKGERAYSSDNLNPLTVLGTQTRILAPPRLSHTLYGMAVKIIFSVDRLSLSAEGFTEIPSP